GTLTRYLGGYTAYANGEAKALDRRDADRSTADGQEGSSPEQRLESLEREAEALTTRLAQTGSTTSVDHLAELTERYASLLAQLDEAGDEWLQDIHAQLHASSV
ncbi:MAG TPA: ABC transporter C-terminal domain-containing protein, partial [Chloroflexota bacterium]